MDNDRKGETVADLVAELSSQKTNLEERNKQLEQSLDECKKERSQMQRQLDDRFLVMLGRECDVSLVGQWGWIECRGLIEGIDLGTNPGIRIRAMENISMGRECC